MKDATKFSSFLKKSGDTLPPHLLSLARTAKCAFSLIEKNPEAIAFEPRLKEMCAADINNFEVAYAALKPAS